MTFIQKGSMPHSYRVNIFGIKIRFRNIFAIKNNKIIIVDKNGHEKTVRSIKGLKVIFQGENASVKIYKPAPRFTNTTIICGDSASVIFRESNTKISNLFIHNISEGGLLYVGKNVKFRGGEISIKENMNLKVIFGDECLIAPYTKFWTTDFHTIFNVETKQPLNPPADIIIGKHCWICEGVTISKGVTLADDTIVAHSSIVTKSFDKPNTILGGIPAKIIKDQNTSWTETPYDVYLNSLG